MNVWKHDQTFFKVEIQSIIIRLEEKNNRIRACSISPHGNSPRRSISPPNDIPRLYTTVSRRSCCCVYVTWLQQRPRSDPYDSPSYSLFHLCLPPTLALLESLTPRRLVATPHGRPHGLHDAATDRSLAHLRFEIYSQSWMTFAYLCAVGTCVESHILSLVWGKLVHFTFVFVPHWTNIIFFHWDTRLFLNTECPIHELFTYENSSQYYILRSL